MDGMQAVFFCCLKIIRFVVSGFNLCKKLTGWPGGYNGLNSTKCVIFTLLLVRRVLG